NVANKIEDRQIRRSRTQFRTLDRLVDVLAIGFRHFALGYIGAIHGEAGDDLSQGIAQAFHGEIAGVAVRKSNTAQMIRKDVQFAVQRAVHHQLFALIHKLSEIDVLADELLVSTIERFLSTGVNEKAVYQGGKFVSCGSVDGPVSG